MGKRKKLSLVFRMSVCVIAILFGDEMGDELLRKSNSGNGISKYKNEEERRRSCRIGKNLSNKHLLMAQMEIRVFIYLNMV